MMAAKGGRIGSTAARRLTYWPWTRERADARRGRRNRKALWLQVFVSVMIAALGVFSARALEAVDQDLRSMYTEYTLAATRLAHTSTDLLRYRVTVTRALEAQNRKELDRRMASLPDQRARIVDAVEQYAVIGRSVLKAGSKGELDLLSLRRSLDEYFAVSDTTLSLLVQMADAPPDEAERLRRQAEQHAVEEGGPKLVEANEALEQLLQGVADTGKKMREEGSATIRNTSIALVIGSLVIAMLNILW